MHTRLSDETNIKRCIVSDKYVITYEGQEVRQGLMDKRSTGDHAVCDMIHS